MAILLLQFIFAERERDESSCHHCVSLFVRTTNIIEKMESGCVQLQAGQRTFDNVCAATPADQQLVTMFRNKTETSIAETCKRGFCGPLTSRLALGVELFIKAMDVSAS